MKKSRKSIGSNLSKLDRHRVTKAELREAPPLTAEQLERAEIRDGDRIIRRGRPLAGSAPKKQITVRLDADVIERFQKDGPGWQSRMNQSLRKAAGLK